jgi:hypothetical protein
MFDLDNQTWTNSFVNFQHIGMVYVISNFFLGYCCDIQENTKYFSYMVFTRCTPHVSANNNLSGYCDAIDK